MVGRLEGKVTVAGHGFGLRIVEKFVEGVTSAAWCTEVEVKL
jgi:hypothetical protein